MSEATAKVMVAEINQVTKKLEFDVPWEVVKEEIDKCFHKIGKTAKIKGFRQGKVPRPIVEKFYRGEATSEAAKNLINKYFFDSLEKEGIVPVAEPLIDEKGIEYDKDYSFAATVEVEPVFDPQGYLGLNLTKINTVITGEDIAKSLLHLRRSFGTLQDAPPDRRIGSDSIVTINSRVTVEGKEVNGLSREGSIVNMSDRTIVSGLKEQLLGMSRGEGKEFSLMLPEVFKPEDLASKEAFFKVEITNIQEEILPEANEEFVKNFDEFSSMAELEERIYKSLQNNITLRAGNLLKKDIIDELLKANDFQVPPSLVEKETFFLMQDQINMMTARGYPREKSTAEVIKQHEQYREIASKRIKFMYLIKGIAAKENLSVHESETDSYVEEMAREKNSDLTSFKEQISKNNMLEMIKEQILEDKVLRFIEEKAQVSTVERPENED